MNGRSLVGRHGEDVAVAHLVDDGMTVLARNWRCSQGEIDIVALDGAAAVVVEVKARRTSSFGRPVESVTAAKLARLRRLAAAWLAAQDRAFEDVRVDVVGVMLGRGPAQVEHLRGVG